MDKPGPSPLYVRAARRFCTMMAIDPDATHNGLQTQLEYWTNQLEIHSLMECAVNAELEADQASRLPRQEG